MQHFVPLHIPEIIAGSCFYLRMPQLSDAPQLMEAIRETETELLWWIPSIHHVPSLAEAETTILEIHVKERAKTDLIYYVYAPDQKRMIGWCGAHHIDWSVPRFEIGYWLRKGETGKGIMTEAVNLLSQLLFERFHAERIEIRCDARNLASAAVAQRTGYLKEAHLRNEARDKAGQLRDLLIYARLREQEPSIPTDENKV